jgi:hypothetical protein
LKPPKKWNLEPTDLTEHHWSGDWFVLRCSNRHTLPLVASLGKEGLRSWTPIWFRKRRYPRSSKTRDVLLPCLPSFVFLPEPDLVRAQTAAEFVQVPSFSVMAGHDGRVRLKDHHLDGLRKASTLTPRATNPIPFPKEGRAMKITSGPFQGLHCIVLGRSQRHSLVRVEGGKLPPIKVPPFLLEDLEA